MIQVRYIIDKPSMTDEEYEDQDFRYFNITDEMIRELICQNTTEFNKLEVEIDHLTIN